MGQQLNVESPVSIGINALFTRTEQVLTGRRKTKSQMSADFADKVRHALINDLREMALVNCNVLVSVTEPSKYVLNKSVGEVFGYEGFQAVKNIVDRNEFSFVNQWFEFANDSNWGYLTVHVDQMVSFGRELDEQGTLTIEIGPVLFIIAE